MKAISFISVLLVTTTSLFSQNFDYKKPDYEEIEKIIQEKTSEFYYPNLMNRYQKNDTTLTLDEYRVLYYGYLFHDAYTPYGTSTYVDSLRQIFNRDSLSTDDFLTVIRFEEKILEEYPFNLRDINTLTYALFHVGDTLKSMFNYLKLNMLIETILSTGDGETEQSAWHVISVNHEYDILNILGFDFSGMQTLTQNRCDFLKVNDNEYGIEGLYFDVSMLLKMQSKTFNTNQK